MAIVLSLILSISSVVDVDVVVVVYVQLLLVGMVDVFVVVYVQVVVDLGVVVDDRHCWSSPLSSLSSAATAAWASLWGMTNRSPTRGTMNNICPSFSTVAFLHV